MTNDTIKNGEALINFFLSFVETLRLLFVWLENLSRYAYVYARLGRATTA